MSNRKTYTLDNIVLTNCIKKKFVKHKILADKKVLTICINNMKIVNHKIH